MVHKKVSKKKLNVNLEMLDKMVEMMGWNMIERSKTEKDYLVGNKKVKFTKVNSGYKIILFKNNKLYSTDITPNKDMAITLLGETLMFRSW